MKIALISLYNTISAFGLRSISACLKREGHDVKLIFLPSKYTVSYQEIVFRELVELIKGSQLVGVSLMTNYFENAIALTQFLQNNITAPIIWGGIHPTIRPEECLHHVDMVCIGEGEKTVIELARKMRKGQDYLGTQGLWFKYKGEIMKNNLRPLIQDLDSLPFQDYDYETHYLLHDNRVLQMDEDLLKMHLRNDYLAHPTRGCPYGCTYCCNNTFNKLYPAEQKKPVRKRSIENVIQELVKIIGKLPFINHITFDDDSFFFYSEEDIATFSDSYRRSIGLPLEIRGANPSTVTNKKLSLLVDAGLTGVRLGIQTGSNRTKRLYKRHHTNEQVEEVARIIHEFKETIPLPKYDIIINNPWETEEDLTETLMLFAKLPKPYLLNMFSLVFYPGTELYEKAVEDRIITDDLKDVYRKSYNVRADGTSGKLLNESYFNNLFYLLYVYAIEGQDINVQTLSLLANRKAHPIRSRLLYFMMRQKAGIFLKKRLLQGIIRSIQEGGVQRDEYALD